MSWADDFMAGTYETTTSTVGNVGQIFYDRKFLRTVNEQLKLIYFGQRRPIPEANGLTIQFNRWLKLAASVSAATLTEGVNPSAMQLTGQKLSATLGEYGAFAQLSSLLKQSHIDPQVSSAAELFGEHAGVILDRLCHMEVCANGAMPIRADFATDTGATFNGVVDSATTTTIVDANLSSNSDYGDANDDLNQSIVTITSGGGYGQQRAVTDYATATGTITVSPAWDVTPSADDTFVVTTADGIASGDKPTFSVVKKCRASLKRFHAPAWGPGNYYIGLIDPDVASDLMDDTTWIDVHKYKDNKYGLIDGEIGKIGGVRFVEHTNPFKFNITTRGTAGSSYGVGATGANFSETGTVVSTLILGKEAFGVSTFKNKKGNLPKPPIIVKKPGGKNDTSNPLDRYGTVGWALEFVCKSLNPLFARQIWSYNHASSGI